MREKPYPSFRAKRGISLSFAAPAPFNFQLSTRRKRLLRAHPQRGKRGVKIGARKRLPFRQSFRQKHRKTSYERIARSGRVLRRHLKRRDQSCPFRASQQRSPRAQSKNHFPESLLQQRTRAF